MACVSHYLCFSCLVMRRGDRLPRRVHVPVWSRSEIKKGTSKEQRVLEQGMAYGVSHASFPTELSPPCHPFLPATEADPATEIFKGPKEMAAAWSSSHD